LSQESRSYTDDAVDTLEVGIREGITDGLRSNAEIRLSRASSGISCVFGFVRLTDSRHLSTKHVRSPGVDNEVVVNWRNTYADTCCVLDSPTYASPPGGWRGQSSVCH